MKISKQTFVVAGQFLPALVQRERVARELFWDKAKAAIPSIPLAHGL